MRWKMKIVAVSRGKVKPAPLDYGTMNNPRPRLTAGGCLTKKGRRSIIGTGLHGPGAYTAIHEELSLTKE
jgi:hypothetical protein